MTSIAMTNEQAVRNTISTLTMEGFPFDEPAKANWAKIASGELTTHQFRKQIMEQLEELKKKSPGSFSAPDSDTE